MSTRPPIPREFIEDHQRRRLVRAAAALADEHGAAGITTTRLTGNARMARNTFYNLFATKDAFLEFAFERAFAQVFDPVLAATQASSPWLERLDAGVEGFFGGVAKDPPLAALCLIHAQESEAGRGRDYQAGVNVVVAMLAGGREAGRGSRGGRYRDPPANTEEFLGQAIVSLAALRLQQGLAADLAEHWQEMAALASTPFFGSASSARFAAGLAPNPEQLR
jgi:AcrR family transcriptional regulator